MIRDDDVKIRLFVDDRFTLFMYPVCNDGSNETYGSVECVDIVWLGHVVSLCAVPSRQRMPVTF